MAGPSFNQLMMLGGIGVAGIALYEIWVNQGSIQAAIQNFLNPINPYQQQGYYCPGGGVPGPTGLCPNGQPAINQSQFNQIASMAGGCSDGSIVNPATGRCANGSYPMPTTGYGNPYSYGAGGLGYPQTSVCNDGSMPNPVNGLCANGSIPTTVGTGVNNSMMNPYGAPQYVQPSITGGVGVPGTTTFTDPTTGQTYDPSTGMLLTPGGSYTTPSLATPYGSIFPTLNPLGGGWTGGQQGSQIGTCADGSTVNAGTGVCQNGQPPLGTVLAPPNTTSSSPPVSTTVSTPNPVTGTLSCADGSATNANGLCNNGQPPVVSLPAGTTPTPSGTVPVTAAPTPTGVAITPTPAPTPAPVTTPTPAPTPVVSTPPTTQVSTTPVTTTTGTPGTPGGSTSTTTTNTTGQHNRFGGSGGNMQSRYRFNSYVGYQSEGAMIAAQAFGSVPRDRSRASVTSYSSVRPKSGNSPITNELFARRFYTSTPIYVSGIY